MVMPGDWGACNVRWDRHTNFTGRNGYHKCSGMELIPIPHNDSILISAITSRGDVARCNIDIPRENIPDLITALQGFVKQAEAAA